MPIWTYLVVYAAFGSFFMFLGNTYQDNLIFTAGFAIIFIGIVSLVFKLSVKYRRNKYLSILKALNQ